MKRGWAGFALMVAGVLGSAAASADPMPIRVGWVVTPGHLAPLIEALGKREPGVFKHLGQSYVLQTTRFQGTTPQIQAQAIGDLDVAALSTAALALAITNAKLEERVVADVVADGIEGFYSENYVVAADGPIKTIEDVKGKRIATNAIGSASDAAMRTMFRKHGLKDSDFTTVETNFANMPAMLDGRQSGFDRHIAAIPQAAARQSQQIPRPVHRPRGRRANPGGAVGHARRDDRGASAGFRRFL
jgi:sulfonate transport system substrate-binding protein